MTGVGAILVLVRWLALVATCAACGYAPGSVQDASGGDATGSGHDSGTGIDGATDSGCVDVDHDGICDAVDDWLCGTRPSAPGTAYLPAPSNVALVNFGTGGAFVTTVPGAATMVGYAYGIQVACPSGQSCTAQIEFGIAGVGRSGCLFDGTVNSNQFEGAFSQQATITSPVAPGQYEVRAKLATNTACGTGAAWSGGTQPPSTGTFAYICVPE